MSIVTHEICFEPMVEYNISQIKLFPSGPCDSSHTPTVFLDALITLYCLVAWLVTPVKDLGHVYQEHTIYVTRA